MIKGFTFFKNFKSIVDEPKWKVYGKAKLIN